MRENIKCFRCNNKLTKEEIETYFDEGTYCCVGHNGYMCGCYGMPVDPPICDKCSKELEGEEYE